MANAIESDRLKITDSQAGTIREVFAGLVSEGLDDARNQHYPGWWTYTNLGSKPEDERPWYRVVAQGLSGVDLLRAIAAKPDFVRVEFVFPK